MTVCQSVFPEPGPRLFGLPPGADFPARLAQGLIDRFAGQPPEAMARVTVYLNSQRMRRRLREAFIARGAGFLPRMRLVSEPGNDPLLTGAVEAVSPLGRRLELAVLIDRLLQAEPDLAPRHALYDLADSLANLMDEMRAETVDPASLDTLDIEGHAAHWARTRRFVSLIGQFFVGGVAPDGEARLRLAVLTQIAAWQAVPPQDPVIVAGSTGSRGTSALLMQAVAQLPQGAILVPGYDFDQPAPVWASLDDGISQEDHPQYRYHRLMRMLDLHPDEVLQWDAADSPDPARNRLISLAMRPAPVTDQWISEGPRLGDLVAATAGMTLIEAPNPRAEAQAIALCLRDAVARGRTAALLTPDRDLTRRVTAALDRWRLVPDDSAGSPLIHSPSGRMLRLVARAMGKRLMADEVLTILKHPLCHSNARRGPHLRLTHELELELRRNGPAFPDLDFLQAWAEKNRDPFAPAWAQWLGAALALSEAVTPGPLPDLIARHRAIAEVFSAGAADPAATDTAPTDTAPTDPAPTDTGKLWLAEAGEAALRVMDDLAKEAPAALSLGLGDYAALADGVINRAQVRSLIPADERIVILGAQEARVQGADMVILAGLTEGVWPAQPDPDPWLNRKMRMDLGLLLPERRIGLSAHDWQMAIAAPEVALSHAHRNAEAETVPSRWLNRLTNLMDGLPGSGGRQALAAMRGRGAAWLQGAVAVEAPIASVAARRPSPRPPVEARPKSLSLTEIEKLIRDPYAIYARHLLRLRPLMPVRPMADARLRGEVLHKVPEALLREGLPPDPQAAAEALMRITDQVLEQDVAWPAMRAIWRARMADLAQPFVESLLAEGGHTVSLEKKYAAVLQDPDFTLIGKPDRIDVTPEGRLRIVDYKTGAPPTEKQQAAFAKQLHLAAVMASLGAFPEVGPHDEVEIAYIRLAADLKTVSDTLGPGDLARILEEFRRLIRAWEEPGRGYTARQAMLGMRDRSDYDDLARFGEWDLTAQPWPEDLT
ncbi:double-strand break repair protein AddB [Xinfangfangia sp. D13-10-4-6]|uniref:double-strand break repair protein AddB n=1 Tax=Pseudogemmobacter hezensis TaxID=2737662 RepID=UPI0015534228|nr:double-strand break repair protein AddB [Pseudogemmobacter hezensis]NPD14273.1 double-strand break repair protein AddB [Pseudogemmobacter hezensis]